MLELGCGHLKKKKERRTKNPLAVNSSTLNYVFNKIKSAIGHHFLYYFAVHPGLIVYCRFLIGVDTSRVINIRTLREAILAYFKILLFGLYEIITRNW